MTPSVACPSSSQVSSSTVCGGCVTVECDGGGGAERLGAGRRRVMPTVVRKCEAGGGLCHG